MYCSEEILQKDIYPGQKTIQKHPLTLISPFLYSSVCVYHSLDFLQKWRGSSSILKRKLKRAKKKNYSSPFDKIKRSTFHRQVLQKNIVLSNIIAILWIFWHPGLCWLAIHWTKFVTFCRQLNPDCEEFCWRWRWYKVMICDAKWAMDI